MAIGSIIAFAGSTLPDHYLLCDGAAISRADYADLFDVIGTAYGAGDGSTTFNLPNLAGRVAMGVTTGQVLGNSSGEETHLLTTSELPTHSHTIPQHTHANTIGAKTPQLTHSITQPAYTYTKLNAASANGGAGTSVSGYNATTSAAMTRSTNLSIADHAATACTMSGSIADCAALTSGSIGGDGRHNNMMPYIAVNYIICAEPEIPPGPRMFLFNGCLPVTAGGAYICGKGRA